MIHHNLWFAADEAPTQSTSIGSVPGTGLRYSTDGASLPWALAVQPVAQQQRLHPDEFAEMPDLILHTIGYRLMALAGIDLPRSLAARTEGGPTAFSGVPLAAALITIAGEESLAFQRRFGPLHYTSTVHRGVWVATLSPSREPLALVETSSPDCPAPLAEGPV